MSSVASDAAGAPAPVLAAIDSAVDELAASLIETSHDLAAHPEVAFEEHRSAAQLAELVESHGIAVTRGAYGLPTALRAEVAGSGPGPSIAVLAEYDALPGIGHGCGHNIIATAGVGAFLALAKVRDQLPGKIIWMGTPAEEGGSGKELMAREGAFDDVDASIMVHPFTYDCAEPVFLGRRQLKVIFHGITSHASAQPFMGRNALDAVNLMYMGVAANRQQMPFTDRVHAVITEGGERPNVIPDRASILYYVRSQYPETLKILSSRMEEIAQGAGLMAGCGVELVWDEAPPYLPMRGNTALAQSWNRRYGDRGHEVLPAGVLPSSSPDPPTSAMSASGSPALHPMVKITGPEFSLHTRDFAAEAITETADRVIIDSAGAMAAVAADYLCDPDLQAEVRAEFDDAGGAVDVPHYFD
ncbi:M20 family metallopeptidase [Naumannella halotolerans]|nr:M20 family metallopeptidase [Naumannella halotolerans]